MISLFSYQQFSLTAESCGLMLSRATWPICRQRERSRRPYRRRTVVFGERLTQAQRPQQFRGEGVRVAAIVEDPNPPRLEHDPEHPDADEEGFVAYPNIDLAKEMTDLITASRSYEASTTAINTAKSLYLKALEIGRG